MPYNLNELRTFLCVAQEGSLGKAAEKLSLTQPALSRIVKRLESDVGPDGQVKFPHPWPPQIPPGRTVGL